MVKAKKFWNYLCEVLDYRVFVGVPCLGLNPLYKVMDKSIMYYMPAANERIALGISCGVVMSGTKSGVLLSETSLIGIGNEIELINNFNIPILLIVYSEVKRNYPFWHIELSDNFKKDLDKISGRKTPSVLVIKGGTL